MEFLPLDIQREICLYLLHRDIKKINPKFYQDENDVYWKMKVSLVTNEKKPGYRTYRDFYEYIVYVKTIEQSAWYGYSYEFDEELFKKMLEDEIFMTKYINSTDKRGNTALNCAALFLEKEYVQRLLDAGANVNLRGEHGRTALMLVSYYAEKNSDIEIVELLLAAYADTSITDNYGYDAYSLASYLNNVPEITLLLKSYHN
jgi:hypothetical protein